MTDVNGHVWIEGEINGPSGGMLMFDTKSGQIEWTANNADVTNEDNNTQDRSPYSFTVVADNQFGGVTKGTPFPVTVTNADTAIASVPDQVIMENGNLSITEQNLWAPGTDQAQGPAWYGLEIQRLDPYPDGTIDRNVYSINDSHHLYNLVDFNSVQTVADQITFNTKTGAISWNPDNRDVGEYVFTVTQYDGHGSSAPTHFDVTIQNVAPVFVTSPSNTVLIQGSHFTYDAGTDQDGLNDWRDLPNTSTPQDQVLFSVKATDMLGNVMNFNDLTINPHNGALTWTSPPVGTFEVFVTVDDGNGGRTVQEFRLTTLGINLPLDWRPDAGFAQAMSEFAAHNGQGPVFPESQPPFPWIPAPTEGYLAGVAARFPTVRTRNREYPGAWSLGSQGLPG